MSRTDLTPLLFDPQADFLISAQRLPHWSQAGTWSFITWRTNDSLPAEVVEEWRRTRDRWLISQGFDPKRDGWRQQLATASFEVRRQFRLLLADNWERRLDECHGRCELLEPELASIVAKSLRHFDGERYLLDSFVVMPNHVHLIAAFDEPTGMLEQCDNWKHFTSTQINRKLGRMGRFWQPESFDHLIRTEDELHSLRAYIVDNPIRAGLKTNQFVLYCRDDVNRE